MIDWLLYEKNWHTDVHVIIVKILVDWYSHHKKKSIFMFEWFIRWGNSSSDQFYVTNGVKQGGIMSPALFNAHGNNISLSLNQSGGSLGNNIINHICYDDDLCLNAVCSNLIAHIV